MGDSHVSWHATSQCSKSVGLPFRFASIGQAINPGAARSPRGISATLLGPSHVRNLQRTLPSLSLASLLNTKAGQWKKTGSPPGRLVPIRSTSLIWCSCDSIMSRKAVGKRSFSSSDLGHEKATTRLSCSCSFSFLSALWTAPHHISVYFFLFIFSAFSLIVFPTLFS